MLILISLGLRRIVVAIAASVGLAASAAALTPYTEFAQSIAAPDASTFRLVTFNIWFRNDDLARAAEYLERIDADAVVLQEASVAAAQELQALTTKYRYAFFNHERHGAAILSKWPMLDEQSLSQGEGGTRASQVRLRWRHTELTLIGVHLHWPLGARDARLRNQELAALARLAAAIDGPLLVAGDFNITPWSPHFRDLLRNSALQDCGRGQGLAASWPSHARWLGIRIDHCLASRHWRTIELRTGPHVGSDHRPVVADLEIKNERRVQPDAQAQSARAVRRMM